MKKFTLLLVAFLLCGLVTKAQQQKYLLDSQINYIWDGTSNIWTNEAKYGDVSYDSNGNMLSWLSYTWSKGIWNKEGKGVATYVSNKNTERLYYTWDVSSNSYTYDSRDTYTYTSAGNLETQTSYVWENAAWQYDYKENYVYNASGKQIEYLNQSWNVNTWENNYKYTYTYNTSGKILTRTYYDTDANSNFQTSSLETHSYDTNGNLAYTIDQSWNTSSFDNNSKTVYTYDASGNNTSELYQYWSSTSSTWVNNYLYTYSYDANGNQIAEIDYSWNGTKWDNDYKYVYGYSLYAVTEVSNPSTPNTTTIRLYPNPAQNEIRVSNILDNASFSIYDTQGKLVQKSNSSPIDISALTSGVYLLKIVDKNGSSTQKFVKQ